MVDADDWDNRPKDNFPAWILPFIAGFSIGGLVGFFLL